MWKNKWLLDNPNSQHLKKSMHNKTSLYNFVVKQDNLPRCIQMEHIFSQLKAQKCFNMELTISVA